MGSWVRGFTSGGLAIALAAGVVVAAPVAHSQDADALVLNVTTSNGTTYGQGAAYWCDDTDAADDTPTSSTNPCNFATKADPLKLMYPQSIGATVFTDSSNAATLSVSGSCAVGTSPADASNPPASAPVQVAAGSNVYVTALAGSGKCVMTGTTPGGGSLAPGTFTYTINLIPGDQNVNSPLQMPKRMTVNQRFRVKGVDPQPTNAGQVISWQVLRSSRGNCRLTELTSGAVVLRAISRGRCRLQATAPAVAGEWNAFVQQFTVPIR